MHKLVALTILAALLAAACGDREPPPPAKPQPTVFDTMINKERTIPADIEKAQREHIEELHRQDDAANGATPADRPR